MQNATFRTNCLVVVFWLCSTLAGFAAGPGSGAPAEAFAAPEITTPFPGNIIQVGVGQEFIIPYSTHNLDETLYEIYPLVTNSDLTIWKRYRGSEIGGYAEEQHLGTHQIELWAQSRRAGIPDPGRLASLQLQIVSSCQSQAWYTDGDGDGFGRQLLARSCTAPAGAVSQQGDCDDTMASVYPGASELADGQDNDCDGTTDEQAGDNQRPTILVEELQGPSGALPHEPGTTYTYRITVHNPEPNEPVQLALDDYYQSAPEDIRFSPALPQTGTGTFHVDMHWTPNPNTVADESLELLGLLATDESGLMSRTSVWARLPSELPQIYIAADTFRIGVNQPFRIDAFMQDDVTLNAFLYPMNSSLPWDTGLTESTKTTFANYDDESPGPEYVGLHRVLLVAFEDYVYTNRLVYKPFYVWVDPQCTTQEWYPDTDGDGYGIVADYYQNSYRTCNRPSEHYVTNSLDCDDTDAAIYPGAGDCPAAENQAPTITLAGDAGLEQYEVGQEYTILVEVSDPEGDEVTLDMQVYQWEPDPMRDKIPLTAAHLSPAFPITQTAPYTVAVRFTPEERFTRANQLTFTATDAASNTTETNTGLYIWQPPRFALPADTVSVAAGEFFRISIPVTNWFDGDLLEVESPSLPVLSEGDYGILFITSLDEYGVGSEYIGHHTLTLTLSRGDYVHQSTLIVAVEAICEAQTWYADADGDGYGNPDQSQQACNQPDGYVAQAGDCDDENPDFHPGAIDYPWPFDDYDSDCDGIDPGFDADEDGIHDLWDFCPNVYNPEQEDMDGDQIGDACDDDIDGDGFINEEDCDPLDATIYPGAEEQRGDGVDNNCNGAIDESLCDASEPLTVASACSNDPEKYRTWVVYNPNHCPVTIRYDLRQSDIEGSMEAMPGETYFQTPFIPENMNIMQIHWQDDAGREQMYRYREPHNTGLRVFTVCSENPAEELRWRVYNPNPCPYYVEWHIEGSSQGDSYIAPPGDSYFTSATLWGEANVAVLMYYNYHSKKRYSVQASAYRNCSGNQEPNCTISQELTIASSCSDDPFNYQNWVIYNPNTCAVKVRYDLRHTNQQASLMAEPGYTYISTPFIEGSRNIMDLHWQDSWGKDHRYRFREPANTGLDIFSVCSDDPTRELRWRVHNPNPCPYYVQWTVRGSQQKGSFLAPPGDSYFSTRPEAGANLAQISYYNYQSTRRTVQKAATFKSCSEGPIRTVVTETDGLQQTPSLSAELAVYPVPFRDVLQVRHAGIRADQPVRLALVSLSGTTLEVHASQIQQREGALELDLQQLPLADGLYLLRLDIGGEKPLYQRVIRQR